MRSDWTQTTLGSLVSEGSAEYQTGPFGTMLKASEYSVDGTPLISVGEIREGFFAIHNDTPRVCEKTKQRLPQFVLAEGDIVFGRKGAIHRNAIISKEQEGWFLGSDGIRLRLSSKYDPLFVSYFLRTPMISRWLIANSPGAIMPTLNESILDRVPLFLPKKPEQQRISSTLSTLDEKIENNQRMNEDLEGVAKLLYDYWFVQFDFPMTAAQAASLGKPHLTGHPYRASGGPMTYNETLKREIPMGWEVRKLSAFCHHIRDTVDPSNVAPGTPYVGLEHVPRRRFTLDAWGTAGSVTSLKSHFKSGDVLFGKLRPYFHKVVRAGIDGICSSELLVLRYIDPKFEGFLGSVLFSDVFVEATSNQWGGSKMPRAEWSRMKEYLVPCPPDDLLTNFNDRVIPMWELGATNQRQTQELTTLRDWLLPMLMNGQVTVN